MKQPSSSGSNSDLPSIYTLGASADEQRRLLEQRDLYGDTTDIQFAPAARICELGCGPGSNLWLASGSPEGSYYGIDCQKEQVSAGRRRAQELGLTNARFDMGDAAGTGLPAESFDAVFMRCLLVHTNNPDAVVKEAVRIVRRGGRIVIIEPDDTSVHLSPNKSNLIRCWRMRSRYMANVFRTNPDYVREDFHLLHLFFKAEVEPHRVRYDHTQPELCRRHMNNFLRIIERVSTSMIGLGYISQVDLDAARFEANEVNEGTFAEITLWRAIGTRL